MRLLLAALMLLSTLAGSAASDSMEYFGFIPKHIGNIKADKKLSWTVGECTDLSLAVSSTGLATVTNNCQAPYNETYHIMGTPTDFHFGPLPTSHQFEVNDDFKAYGVRVFQFNPDTETVSLELLATVGLFAPLFLDDHNVTKAVALDNLAFLNRTMGYELEDANGTIGLDASEFRSGDFLGILRLDGLDPLVGVGTGSHLGHTAMVVGKGNSLYVLESQEASSYWPHNGVQMNLIGDWLDMAEKAQYNVVRISLNPYHQNLFNQNTDKVWDWFHSVEGSPYGLFNFLFGWIDTPDSNFPNYTEYRLSSQLMMMLLPFTEQISHRFGLPDMWVQAFNHRLGTTNLTTLEVYDKLNEAGRSFESLLTQPEQDEWLYDGKPSMVCNVFLCQAYREAGLFENTTVQCTEFTPFDLYELNWWGTYEYVMGDYIVNLPHLGEVGPFSGMREKCPSMSPHYAERLSESVRTTC